MGKMKELAIDHQNNINEAIQKLEENTKDLKCEDFDEVTDPSKVKEILSDVLKIIKEIKSLFLL